MHKYGLSNVEEMLKYVWNSVGCHLNTKMVKNIYPDLVESTHVGPCPSVPHIDRDKNRDPEQILTYSCGECHEKHCSKHGNFRCQEIRVKIDVKMKKGKHNYVVAKLFPAGCICMSHVSILGKHVQEPRVYVK